MTFYAAGRRSSFKVDRPFAGKTATGSYGSFAGLHERRLAGSTIHEIGLPESGYLPPAPYAKLAAS
jgi:hypothetical protein